MSGHSLGAGGGAGYASNLPLVWPGAVAGPCWLWIALGEYVARGCLYCQISDGVECNCIELRSLTWELPRLRGC